MALYFAIMGLSIVSRSDSFLHDRAVDAVLRVHLLSRSRRSEFCDVYALAPEQLPDRLPRSAIAFVSSIGRFVGVAMVFLLASGISYFGSLGTPVALTAMRSWSASACCVGQETHG